MKIRSLKIKCSFKTCYYGWYSSEWILS